MGELHYLSQIETLVQVDSNAYPKLVPVTAATVLDYVKTGL